MEGRQEEGEDDDREEVAGRNNERERTRRCQRRSDTSEGRAAAAAQLGADDDSDLLDGRREMSSDTNQMIQHNNNFLAENNHEAATRGGSTNKPGPGDRSKGQGQHVEGGGGEEGDAPVSTGSKLSNAKETGGITVITGLVEGQEATRPGRRHHHHHHQDTRETRKLTAAIIANPPKPHAQHSKQQQQQQQQAQSRAKFIKSKSSPSSLTTHKFGLRPTPSPPRLIIDHQTGDIIESYPEQPVYLRTYQPIDPEEEEEHERGGSSLARYHNQLDELVPVVVSQASFLDRRPQRTETTTTDHHNPELNNSQTSLGYDSEDQLKHNQQQQRRSRPNQEQDQSHYQQAQQMNNVPPPPHASAKIYFAPPATNASPFGDHIPGSQHHQHQQRPMQQAGSPGGAMQAAGSPVSPMTSRERARASFRKAIHQLADTAERTDIAIVTEPDDYDGGTGAGHTTRHPEVELSRTGAPKQLGQMRVTATSASKGDALLNQASQQQHRRQQPTAAATPTTPMSGTASKLYSQPSLRRAGVANQYQKKQQQQQQLNGNKAAALEARGGDLGDAGNYRPPVIEDFNLYSFCYCLRVLLVLLLSGSIIYLLVTQLHEDCSKYRPSPSYVSIITSSVNIISVTIFSLFWFCNGVTRTLYQNISASAFIVTMYSILVCINLALAILFFFIDTCHFQKVLATHSALADWERFSQPLTVDGLDSSHQSSYQRAKRRHASEEQMLLGALDSTKFELLLDSLYKEEEKGRQHSKRQASINKKRHEKAALLMADDPNVIDDQLGGDPDQDPSQPTSAATTATTMTTTTSTSDSYGGNLHDGTAYQSLPQMSPIEAAWEYLKERARAFGRNFYRFLIHYDLKFIGALHALLAACFQYLAIKVAVVRSYFSSTAEAPNF